MLQFETFLPCVSPNEVTSESMCKKCQKGRMHYTKCKKNVCADACADRCIQSHKWIHSWVKYIFICDTYQSKICLFRSGREMFSLFVWSLVLPSFLHHLLPFNKNNLRIVFLIKIAEIHNVKTEYLYSVLMNRELLVFLSPMSYLLFEFRTRKFRSQSMNG